MKLTSEKRRQMELNDDYKAAKKMLTEAKASLDAELRRGDSSDQMHHLNNRRAKLQLKVDAWKQERQETTVNKDELEAKLPELQARLKENESHLSVCNQRLHGLDRNINEATAAGRDALVAYGKFMPELVHEIERETRWREKPLGPVGTLMKLKDASWAPVLETVIGKTLNAFLVTHEQDRALLMSIMRKASLRW